MVALILAGCSGAPAGEPPGRAEAPPRSAEAPPNEAEVPPGETEAPPGGSQGTAQGTGDEIPAQPGGPAPAQPEPLTVINLLDRWEAAVSEALGGGDHDRYAMGWVQMSRLGPGSDQRAEVMAELRLDGDAATLLEAARAGTLAVSSCR
ncbi:MAG: hypothetical protein DIU84_00805 [Bacillota bacterium]|nr:MAG: hypothetical protein DIU84_00805 [Bacillota bacterium]